ncbi:MAG: hypothetical protein ACK5L3_01900 [Oscillospiraceae bacterium]
MSLFYIFYIAATVVPITALWAFAIYFLAVSALGHTVRPRGLLLFAALQTVIQLFANAALLYLAPTGLVNFEDTAFANLWDLAFVALGSAVLTLILHATYHEKPLQTLATVAFCYFVCHTLYYVFEGVLYHFFYTACVNRLWLGYFLLSILPHLLLAGAALGAGLLLRRVRFYHYFSFLFARRAAAFATLAGCLFLMYSFFITRTLLKDVGNVFSVQGISLALLAAAFVLLQTLSMVVAGRERLRAQEEIILQQRAYVALLEDFHTELRAFRHDFKNLLSGMAVPAGKAGLAGAEEFLGRSAGYFDERLGREIQYMNQLARLEIPPLRSLLTVKLGEMRAKGVAAKLDIACPATRPGIKEEDLLRCVGILLDNAAEEAARHTGGEVAVIVLQ